MATWPAGLPAPQKKISITPGDTRVERKLQSGRTEFRRFGDGKPDQAKLLFRLLWVQWETFKEFYEYDLNLGLNWFSASWLATLGYDVHKAKILGYPREVARQGYYVDIVCTLIVQKTAWIIGEDTEWPCAATGVEPPPPDEYGYIYGGAGETGALQDCDEYARSANTWTSKTDMPLPCRSRHAASTIDSAGYIYGGATYLSDCDEYTPDTWTFVADIPEGKIDLTASTIGSSGYVYGGSGPYVSTYQYTRSTNVWVLKADMPSPVQYWAAASTIGSSGYVYGGGGDIRDCNQYTPDTWTVKTDMPLPGRELLAASTIGSSGYIYGGRVVSALQDCDEYTPDTWTSKTDMLTPARCILAASTIDSAGYIYGGATYLSDCDEYTPDTWTFVADIPSPGRHYLAASTI